MKFSTLSIAALATSISTVSATFTIIEPWGTSTWTSGGIGTVQWSSTADEAGKICEMHLLTGNSTSLSFVANLTANGNLIPCDFTQANLSPLPDYAAGTYSIRFGENGGDTDVYAYSGQFQFLGNGTVQPSAPTAPATDAPAPAAPAPATDATTPAA